MKKKNRTKVLFENIFIYGVFGSLEKVIPVIMLPIITRIITDTSEYGIYSMFTTIQSFGIQIAILGLYDAVFREYFEKDDKEYHISVLSTALDIVTAFSVFLCIIMVIFSGFFSKLFLGDYGYDLVIYLSAAGIFAGATRSILSLPVRIRNERIVYISTNFSQAILGYAFAIVMILVFHLDYTSLIYASVITSFILTFFFGFYNRKDFDIRKFSNSESIELLKIGLPLVPTFLIYWVFNSFDKIMVTQMLSLQDVGVFTIGVKLASVSQIIYTAFATGWQYFAFSTMKDDDQVELTSTIMEYLAAFSVFVFLFATIFDEPVFRFVFDGDYELGYIVFPYLFLAPLLLMFYQTGANQFLVYKKSYLSTICLSIGAGANIILNYVLIAMHGIEGAALATLLGYLVSIALMVILLKRFSWIHVSRRLIMLLAIVLTLSLKIYFADNLFSHFMAIVFAIVMCIMYKNDVIKIAEKIRVILRSRKSVKQ